MVISFVDAWLYFLHDTEQIPLLVQPQLGDFDCLDGLVDADPLPVESAGHGNRCPPADKRVENDVAFVNGTLDDAVQQGLRFLRGIADAFLEPANVVANSARPTILK